MTDSGMTTPKLSLQMREIETGERHIISGYSPAGFRINQSLYEHHIVLTHNQIWKWSVSEWAGLETSSFAALKHLNIEILLLGAGQKIQLLPKLIRSDLRAWGMSVDVMDSGAACRTYNILVAEDRAVACALFLPE